MNLRGGYKHSVRKTHPEPTALVKERRLGCEGPSSPGEGRSQLYLNHTFQNRSDFPEEEQDAVISIRGMDPW